MSRIDIQSMAKAYYQLNKQPNKEDNKETKKKKSKLMFIFSVVFSLSGLLFTLATFGIFLIIIFGLLGGNVSQGGSLSQGYYNGKSSDEFKILFSQNDQNIPTGVPLEKGTFTYGFDTHHYSQPIIENNVFLKPYSKHMGVDLGRTWMDKKLSYLPLILSTVRAVPIFTEERLNHPGNPNKYLYKKIHYLKNLETTSESSKYQKTERKNKPYGTHVLLSSLDGKFYILFGHLSSINHNLFESEKTIERGDILGKMGTTGASTANHLHYEIRYCGEDNNQISKFYKDCKYINALGIMKGFNQSFLGLSMDNSPVSKNSKISAGNIEVKKGAIDQSTTEKQIIKEYNDFCEQSKLLFLGRNIDCKTVFPIVYVNKASKIYQNINSEEENVNIGKKYLKDNYGINTENIPKDQINEIALIENIQQYSTKEVFFESLGETFSHGKYQNKEKIYKKDLKTISDQNLEKQKEDEMFIDLLDTLNDKKFSNIIDLYNSYYEIKGITNYKDNPFIYNMFDNKHIFMKTNIGIYKEYGVYTIYKIINS